MIETAKLVIARHARARWLLDVNLASEARVIRVCRERERFRLCMVERGNERRESTSVAQRVNNDWLKVGVNDNAWLTFRECVTIARERETHGYLRLIAFNATDGRVKPRDATD